MSEDTLDIPESPDREQTIKNIQNQSVDTSPVQPTPVEDTEDTTQPVQKQNFTQQFPHSAPLEKEWNSEEEYIDLPSGNLSEIRDLITEGQKLRNDNTKSGKEWVECVEESASTVHLRDVFTASANRENADYRQLIDSEKMPLAAGIPNLKFNTGDKVSGERAVLRVRSLLNLGTILQIPLWHSGFWITMKAPPEASLLELQRRLINEKVDLGRKTHGLAFANTSVYISGWLLDYVISNIYDTTLKGEYDLRKMIKVLDIPTIIWGLACTIWPNGFQYSRACIADPDKCDNVIKEKLNLSKLLWVDRNSLTPKQIAHMTNRGGSSMTLESVENYLSEFQIGRGRAITVGDNNNVTINLKVPNVEEYINSGYKWVENLVSMVDDSLTSEENDTVRNIRINELALSTNMRQYAHWVETIDGDGILIDDTESIEQTVDAMSAVDSIRKKYFDEVIKFIDDSTMSLIAIPTFECPKCKNQQPVPMKKFPHLLPIDVMNSFFILLVRNLMKVRQRG